MCEEWSEFMWTIGSMRLSVESGAVPRKIMSLKPFQFVPFQVFQDFWKTNPYSITSQGSLLQKECTRVWFGFKWLSLSNFMIHSASLPLGKLQSRFGMRIDFTASHGAWTLYAQQHHKQSIFCPGLYCKFCSKPSIISNPSQCIVPTTSNARTFIWSTLFQRKTIFLMNWVGYY